MFSAIAGSGAAVGLIVGGALTQYLSWRWSLLVNAPIGLAVAAGAVLTVGGTAASRGRQRLDVVGAAVISVAFLPLVAGMLVGASLISGRLPRVPPRWLMGTGCLISAAGMLFLTALHPGSPYWSIIMPAAAIFGLGLGIAFTPAMHLATHNVKASDTGIASGLINASQQIGGAIGAALLNTIAAAARWLHAHPQTAGRLSAATVHGYAIGARWSTGILILAALIAFTMVNTSSATRFRGPAVTSCADSAADKRRSI